MYANGDGLGVYYECIRSKHVSRIFKCVSVITYGPKITENKMYPVVWKVYYTGP